MIVINQSKTSGQVILNIMEIDTNKNPAIWCQIQITDTKTLIVQLVALAATLILGVLMAYFAFKVMKDRNQKITSIHVYISLWWMFMLIKTLMNVIMYFVFVQNPIQEQMIEAEMVWTCILLILDNFVTFFLLTAMISIPCHWLEQILNRIDMDQNTVISRSSGQTSQQFQVHKERVFIDRCFKFLKFMKVYRKVRYLQTLLFMAAGIVILLADEQTIKIFNQIYRSWPIFETLVLLMLYAFSLYVLRRLQLILTHLPVSQFNRIILEYSILAFCSIARAAYNLIFLLPINIQYNPQKNCLDDTQNYSIFRASAITVALFIMHIIPATIILNIYWKKDDQAVGLLRHSLLANDNSPQS